MSEPKNPNSEETLIDEKTDQQETDKPVDKRQTEPGAPPDQPSGKP